MNKLYNLEMEQALLGVFLVDGDTVRTIDIHPRDFFIERYQWVHEAMLKVEKADILTVADELDRVGRLQEIGGMSELTKLTTSYITSVNAETYAETIKDYKRKREDLEILNSAVNEIHKDGLDRAGLLSKITGNTDIKGQASHVKNHASRFFDIISERQLNPREIWGMETGFSDIDMRLGGLQKQQTTIIAGAPSVGKTLLVMQIAYQMATFGHKVVVYSFEMDAARLLGRLVSSITGIPTRKMFTGKLNGSLTKVMEAVGNLEGLPLYISDVSGMTTSALRADVARMKALHGIDVAVLDYLNLLLDHDGASEIENTANKSRRWRAICREFDIHGLTVQSMNKAGMDATIPTLSGLSGPAGVSFDADNIFMMAVDPNQQNVVNLFPAKLRDGDSGKLPIKLYKHETLPKFVQTTSRTIDVSNL